MTGRDVLRLSLLAIVLIVACPSFAAERTLTDTEVKQAIIAESLSHYRGNCPCPYNVDRAGRSCGRRSAYSRPGGASPLCYPDDVTQGMVDDYRRSHATTR